MKFLVLGSVNIDETYRVEHIVKEGETISCKGLSRSAGGKGANQAAALAKAGADVIFSHRMVLMYRGLLSRSGLGLERQLSRWMKEGRTQ